jgi:hypothetical protein
MTSHITAAGFIRRNGDNQNTQDQQPRTKEAAAMSDENERSVGSAGSVAERPLGDPEIAVEILRLRVERLEQALRRLAEQDATLSVCDGNVTVSMDATLTDAEREAVEWCIFQQATPQRTAVTLRGLLERMQPDRPKAIATAESDSPQPIATPQPSCTPAGCTVPPEWTSKPYWVDPPRGWRYGFPRLYDPATDGDMTEWMVRCGYPAKLARQGVVCTFTACTEAGEK